MAPRWRALGSKSNQEPEEKKHKKHKTIATFRVLGSKILQELLFKAFKNVKLASLSESWGQEAKMAPGWTKRAPSWSKIT